MSAFETIQAAYAAFGRNDPSVLFGLMDPAISWNEAEGNPLADRNPYVGPQAVGEGVFGRLLAAIDNFTRGPDHVHRRRRPRRRARSLRRHDQGQRRRARFASSATSTASATGRR